jgi:hypothetical protein
MYSNNNNNNRFTIMDSITFNIIGGTHDYHVELIPDIGTTWTFGSAGIKTISPIPPGTYHLMVTDANGCIKIKGGIVIPIPPPPEVTTTTTSCVFEGTPILITSSISGLGGNPTIEFNQSWENACEALHELQEHAEDWNINWVGATVNEDNPLEFIWYYSGTCELLQGYYMNEGGAGVIDFFVDGIISYTLDCNNPPVTTTTTEEVTTTTTNPSLEGETTTTTTTIPCDCDTVMTVGNVINNYGYSDGAYNDMFGNINPNCGNLSELSFLVTNLTLILYSDSCCSEMVVDIDGTEYTLLFVSSNGIVCNYQLSPVSNPFPAVGETCTVRICNAECSTTTTTPL